MSKENPSHNPKSFCCCADCLLDIEDDLVEEKMKEKVDHPSHYNAGELEVIDVIEDWGFGPEFCAGNVIKYVGRYKHKENPLEDLHKARWYLNRLISFLEKEEENV